jgi:hypothetical protein
MQYDDVMRHNVRQGHVIRFYSARKYDVTRSQCECDARVIQCEVMYCDTRLAPPTVYVFGGTRYNLDLRSGFMNRYAVDRRACSCQHGNGSQ